MKIRSQYLLRPGQYEKALAQLRQAYSMASNDPEINYHLAFTFHQLGRNKQAVQVLVTISSLNVDETLGDKIKSLKVKLEN